MASPDPPADVDQDRAVRSPDRHLDEVLDVLHEAVFALDADGVFELVNPSAARLLRVAADDLLGTHIDGAPWTVVDGAGRPMPPERRPPVRALTTGRGVTRVPMGLVHADGAITWIETSTRPLERDGRVSGVLVSFVDVTARREAERALRYRLAFEDVIVDISKRFVGLPPERLSSATDDAVATVGRFLDADRCYVWELDGAGVAFDETHEWCGPGVESFLHVRHGLDREVMPWWWDRMERRENVLVDDVDALPEEAAREHAIFASQGIRSLLCVPVVAGDRLIGFVGVDVTRTERTWSRDDATLVRLFGEIIGNAIERRRTSEALASADRRLRRYVDELERVNADLQRANAAKDEFLSVASHELRTPLTTILGFVQTLGHRWEALDDEQRRRFVAIIGSHGDRLRHLVEDLLEMGRIATGSADPVAEDLDAFVVVRSVLDHLSVRPDEGWVGGAGRVRADEAHLHRIVGNLVTNARKYGRPPITIEIGPADGMVAIRIRDHGSGVPDAFIPRMWDTFTQASTGDRREATGTGLGLAIVRDLVRLNGGVTAYRNADPGAEFTVLLPDAAAVQPSEPDASVRLRGGS